MHVMLNWLWQGSVVAIAAALVVRAISPSRAQARYYALWAAIVAVFALLATPLVWALASPALTPGDIPGPFGPVLSLPGGWWTSTAAALGIWAIWSVAQACRVVASALALRRARKRCRDFPRELDARLHHWSRVRTTGRPARLMLSNHVPSAAVLGCGRPVIAVAPALLDHLSAADLDRVVIHEWAHAQRRDDVAQVVQTVVRVVAGWHPGLWWLDRQLQIEREVACDEAAVAVTGSAKDYAACLATLASIRLAPIRSLPASAVVSPSGLGRRIILILNAPRGATPQSWRPAAITAAVLLAVLTLVVGRFRVVEAAVPTLGMLVTPDVLDKAATAWAEAITPHTSAARKAASDATSRTGTPGGSETSSRGTRSEMRENGQPGIAGATQQTSVPEPPASEAETPLPSRQLLPSRSSVTHTPHELLSGSASRASADTSGADASSPSDAKADGVWVPATAAGVAVGRASQNAAVATAGLFTRFGKRIARSF